MPRVRPADNSPAALAPALAHHGHASPTHPINTVPMCVDQARARLDAFISPLPVQTLALADALGRVLAQPVNSAHPLPLFNQSAVDGYAVRHADLHTLPVRLPLSMTLTAGAQTQHPELPPSTAARILTGGVLPRHADTVVRQEWTQREGDHITLMQTVACGADIRRQGEEILAGAQIAPAGAVLHPGLLGALAMAGQSHLPVRRQPRVVILVTGDEVVSHPTTLRLGQITDANGPLLRAQMQAWGCALLRVEYVPDDPARVRQALQRAFEDADLVVSSGGVSVGDFDFIPTAAESLGAQRILWKVAQKPGMPVYVARCGNAWLFGLPGNPAAVLINAQVYVRHALDCLLGLDPYARWCSGTLVQPLRREPGKTFWLRARTTIDAQGCIHLHALDGQASHRLGNLAQANALVRIPGLHEALEMPTHVRWLAM